VAFDEFSEDATLHAAAERHFQVAIQAALDIGAILLADASVKVPENYRDIFPSLAAIGILPQDFAHKIAGMAQFRNVLVHLYLEVDLQKVYHYMQRDLGDLERFMLYVAEYIKAKGIA
jgi:uncharacterized protein YutE (UPF0331/DUF86 family)